MKIKDRKSTYFNKLSEPLQRRQFNKITQNYKILDRFNFNKIIKKRKEILHKYLFLKKDKVIT